jgi:dipeptidyl aminopeptidase/acylaminoacyl peptidase
MAELKEIFEMVTNQTEPKQDEWKVQEDRQRRAIRSRKIDAFVAVAAVLIIAIAAVAILGEAGGSHTPATSPSQRLVGITSHFLVDVRTGERTEVPALIPGGRLVSVSPDGRTLAFNTCCSTWDPLSLIDIDGTNERTVSAPGSSGYAATWSPDGDTIVFQGRNANGKQLGGLYALDVATGVRSEIADFDGKSSGGWIVSSDISPDGHTVLFHLPRGNQPAWDLWTVPSTGGTPTMLRRDAGFASYGPDGSIVFLDHPKDFEARSIWIMNADGGAPRVLVEGGTYAWPKVSPDGTWVAYESLGRSYIVNVATGRVTDLGGGVEPAWADSDTVIVG